MIRVISFFITPSRWLFCCWLLLLPGAGRAQTHDADADSSRTLFRRVASVVLAEAQTSFRLPDPFVVYHTDRIEIGGRRLTRGVDYWIDYDSGIVTLAHTWPADIPVLIRYERFPASLQRRYAHRRLVIERTLPDSVPVASGARPASRTMRENAFGAFPTTLRAGGSKTFSIVTGSNRDASLEQSLRIQISGQAAPDVEVVAILSDQSSPIQPEGNTRTLQELDNVLVQIRTPHVTTTMGDYNVTLDKTTFARYDRKLKGAQGEVTLPNGSFQIAAAVSEGEYTSVSFQGMEGNQGPYKLTDEDGNDAIIVIAGTEKVWIDGIRMTRGEDNDYTIDYAAAQITFTRHRLITGESRIVVDFEAADQQFQRNLYAGRGEFTVGEGMTVGTTFIREGDDRSNPASVALSQDDITALKALGSDAVHAKITGAEFVGEGAGVYSIHRDDQNGLDYFRYEGPDNGAYTVSFSRVDFGQGSYITSEPGGFQYVGPGQGDFVPQVFLPLPTSQSLIGIDMQAKPASNLSLTGEIAVSNRNLNTFAEGTNRQMQEGAAFLLNTRLDPQPLHLGDRSLGRMEMTGMYRAVQDAFRPAGRIDDAEYGRRYDQGQAASWQGNVMELSARHHMGAWFSVNGGFGRMTRTDGFSSRRQDVMVAAAPQGLPHMTYRYEIIRSVSPAVPDAAVAQSTLSPVSRDNRSVRQKASVTHAWRRISPWIGFEEERRQRTLDGALDDGRNFTEITTGVKTLDTRRFSFSTEFSHRTAEAVGPTDDGARGWLDESVGRTFRHRMSLRDWHALSASAQVIQRYRTFKEVEGETNRESLIDGQLQYAPWQRALSVDARYEATSTQSAQTARRYILVGRGRGNLRLDEDSGEFVSDPDGEYIVRFDQVGDFEPVLGVKSSLRLQASPYRRLRDNPGGFNAFLSNIRTDTYFSVDERTREDDRRAVYLLRLSRFQRDSTTVTGNMTFRQDVFLLPQNRDISVRLRYERISNMNNRFVTGGEARFQETRSIRIRLPLAARTTSEALLAHETKRRTDIGVERYRIESNNGEFSIAHRPTQPLELLLRLNAARDHDTLNRVRATLLGVTPRITYSLRGKGRAQFEIDWASVRSSADTFLPFEMARGRRIGESVRWRGGIDYQVSRYVSLLVQYDGRVDPDRPAIHTARAEMRAFF